MMDDLISRQEAIEWCLEGLNNMPSAQPEQQWIPCSDRLPEEEVEVFVYLFDRPLPYIAWISKGGKWHTEDFTLEADENPVAWMPLPEPWKGEER